MFSDLIINQQATLHMITVCKVHVYPNLNKL